MDWRSAVTDNWPYKLAALALAVLLWFNVTADEQRQEQGVATRLEFSVEDENWVPLDLPDEVVTTFAGRRGDLFAFALPGNRPVIRKEILEVADSVVRVPLSPGDVMYDRQLDVRAISVRPSEVRLSFEPMTFRQVPVTIDLEASAADGYTIVGSPVVQPESVVVRGARSEVASVSHAETERVALDELEATVTRQIPLESPAGLATITLDPSQVLLTLEVDALAERRFRVPLEASGPGADAVRLRPDSVNVTVRGGRSTLRDLEAGDISALAVVPDDLEGERRIQIQVRLQEGVDATATAEPSTATAAPPVGTREGG